MSHPPNLMFVFEVMSDLEYIVWFGNVTNQTWQDMIDALKRFPFIQGRPKYDPTVKSWMLPAKSWEISDFANTRRLTVRMATLGQWGNRRSYHLAGQQQSSQGRSSTGIPTAATASVWTLNPNSARQSGYQGHQHQRQRTQRTPTPPYRKPTLPPDPDLAVLGLSPGIESDEITKVYRDLVKKHHPDRGGDLETMQRINAAMTRIKARKLV
jgi:hypothetical protein